MSVPLVAAETLLPAAISASLAALLLACATPLTVRPITYEDLSRYREESPVEHGPEGQTPIEVFLYSEAAEPDPDGVVSKAARTFELPREAAYHVTRGVLIRGTVWADDETDEKRDQLELSERHLWRAAAIAPDSWVLHRELFAFYEWHRDCDPHGLLRVADHWGGVVKSAKQLATLPDKDWWCFEPLVSALGENPDDVELVSAIVQLRDESPGPMAIATRQYAYERLARDGAEDPIALEVSRSYVGTLLAAGLARQAIHVVSNRDDLEPALWKAPDVPEGRRAFPPSHHRISTSERRAIAIELAAAHLVLGNRERVLALWGDIQAMGEALSAKELACRRLLGASLGDSLGDPFGFLLETGGLDEMETLSAEPWESGASCIQNRIWRDLLSDLAGRYGYPGLQSYYANRSTGGGLGDHIDKAASWLQSGPPELPVLLLQARDDLHALKAHHRDARLPRGVEELPQSAQDRIRSATSTSFEEHRMPRGLRSHISLDAEVERLLDERDSGVAGYAAWREERSGSTVARILLTQDYDPAGEVSAGGYWVLLSRDGGHTWESFYTGLRDRFPYVVRRSSQLSMLHEGELRLEVAVDEVDLDSISFPPLGLASKRKEEDIYLSIPLDVLFADSDEDGLSDIAERALLTDPADSDTDDDGILDGNDALPQIPRDSGDRVRAAALAAALPKILGANLEAHVVTPNASSQEFGDVISHAMGVPAQATNDQALFIVGDREDFGSLEATQRLIVLTSAEARALGDAKGVFYPVYITLFLDHEGERGLVLWDASWTWGRLRLMRTGDGWTATVVSHVIT